MNYCIESVLTVTLKLLDIFQWQQKESVGARLTSWLSIQKILLSESTDDMQP